MQHLCPRCRNAIPTEDDGSLSFCTYCGAPQVRLSEELLTAAESAAPADALVAGSAPPPRPEDAERARDHIHWRGALQCAALSGLIGLLWALLATWKENFSVLALFWALSAPVVTLGIYSARFPASRIRAGFGARLGILAGLAITVAFAAVNIGQTLLQRFVFHNIGTLDAAAAANLVQAKSRMLAWAGPQPPDVTTHMMAMIDRPEFRAGFMLVGFAMLTVLYLLFMGAGGAFAGLMRSRKRAA
jgi:hypothetical protein